jgi:hypothetical protein
VRVKKPTPGSKLSEEQFGSSESSSSGVPGMLPLSELNESEGEDRGPEYGACAALLVLMLY